MSIQLEHITASNDGIAGHIVLKSDIYFYLNNNFLHFFVILLPDKLKPGVDPTKLFFFANEEFFHFLLVSLCLRYIQKKIIDSKMT